MKKLTLTLLGLVAGTAFAGGGFPPPPPPPPAPAGPEISIQSTSDQAVSMIFSAVRNRAEGAGAFAQQNVSSNSGNVTIDGAASTQITVGTLSDISNRAIGDNAYASQNVSSNVGNVTIAGGTSNQFTALLGSYVGNVAYANARAVQNIASNNGCIDCN